jgi:hypothetical protein
MQLCYYLQPLLHAMSARKTQPMHCAICPQIIAAASIPAEQQKLARAFGTFLRTVTGCCVVATGF